MDMRIIMTSVNELDECGQPMNFGFNYKRNKTKAVLTLKGIIDGVLADVILNDIEIIFLRAWSDNDAFNFNDGDFIDIKEQVKDILEDGMISSSEQKDMQQMLNDILEYSSKIKDPHNKSINYLLGFLSGISADDILCDEEIFTLRDNLSQKADYAMQWPANALKARLDLVLKDGIIDDDERHDLMELIKAVSGQTFLKTGLAYGMSADFSTNADAYLKLDGLNICFTGGFLSGSRRIQIEIAKKLGANVVKGINQKLDILVLGSLVSKDWKCTSYGNKIIDVLNNRTKGSTTEIVNEEQWNDLTCM